MTEMLRRAAASRSARKVGCHDGDRRNLLGECDKVTERGWLTRVYDLIDGRRVHICVSWPRRARPEPDSEWLSIIRSRGLRTDIDEEIYGVDEVQAIELAIALLVSLEASNGLCLSTPALPDSAADPSPPDCTSAPPSRPSTI